VEDGVQAFEMDTRHEPWGPLSGRDRYRLRLLVPDLPVAQGEFRVYVYLGDEKALHVHDLRILKPGFSVASPDYVVGLLRPRHVWSREEPRAGDRDKDKEPSADSSQGRVAASS